MIPDSTLSLPAPAKLNLFLHITGRRPDGYHELQTVFQFLEEADTLHFRRREDGLIRLSPELPGVPPASNLIYKAALALQTATGCRLGADITLEKRLPMGGGIGGGSSDAATTLLGLNHLWGLGLPSGELARLGLALGADVPVFVHGHSAWAEGVGEQLTPIELPEPWFLVLTPETHINTAHVFQHAELTRNSSAITVAAFLAGGVRNDCENVVRQLSPAVDTALAWLEKHGPARLTGTGACVFLACNTKAAAEALLKQSPVPGFVSKACNLSPAHRALHALKALPPT